MLALDKFFAAQQRVWSDAAAARLPLVSSVPINIDFHRLNFSYISRKDQPIYLAYNQNLDADGLIKVPDWEALTPLTSRVLKALD